MEHLKTYEKTFNMKGKKSQTQTKESILDLLLEASRKEVNYPFEENTLFSQVLQTWNLKNGFINFYGPNSLPTNSLVFLVNYTKFRNFELGNQLECLRKLG